MTKPKKPSAEDQDRGGFNPTPKPKEKEQFGPLPTDDPQQTPRSQKDKRQRKAKS